MHSVFGKINYGGLKHNSLNLGLVSDRASLTRLSNKLDRFRAEFEGVGEASHFFLGRTYLQMEEKALKTCKHSVL